MQIAFHLLSSVILILHYYLTGHLLGSDFLDESYLLSHLSDVLTLAFSWWRHVFFFSLVC
ncbi:hypothetical protein BJY01DRAFT_227826 [Aspergillus pseudoustus]|uniref:Uncharacterized protein n=1 Tax=Aspergillus pseudoustus TaxID=1810923 RepID=A0ABR4IPH7_9EURO